MASDHCKTYQLVANLMIARKLMFEICSTELKIMVPIVVDKLLEGVTS